MLNLNNKILAKSIALILAQVFMLTVAVYPESSSNKNISSLYIQAKELRVPLDSPNGYGRMHGVLDRGRSVDPPNFQENKTFYVEFANQVRLYLQDTGALCKRHSAVIVERLFKEYKIKAIIMEEIIGQGAHYWVETKDFIIDAFPEGRGFNLIAKIASLETGSVVVIKKGNNNDTERDIAREFYSKGVYQFELTTALWSGDISAVGEINYLKRCNSIQLEQVFSCL